MLMVQRSLLQILVICSLAAASACGAAPTQVLPQVVKVSATSAAYPSIKNVYSCAPSSIAVSLSDPASADISIRLGEPESLRTPAYQIGTDEILVVVNPQLGINALTVDQVRDLFTGQETSWMDVGGKDLPVMVWAYARGEDIQNIFVGVDLAGSLVTSQARLAGSVQNMSDSVAQNAGSIGFLPAHWKSSDTQTVFGGVSVPILAITKMQPQGAVKELLACLQK
jgi:phosphate transport system substrate-binding protein